MIVVEPRYSKLAARIPSLALYTRESTIEGEVRAETGEHDSLVHTW